MSRIKTIAMLAALAAVLGLGTACYRLMGIGKPGDEAATPACAGLSGQARLDCEARNKGS